MSTNVSSYLQGMAMAGGRDAPTLAVMIDNGYNGTAEIQSSATHQGSGSRWSGRRCCCRRVCPRVR
jgi:hypothetical protein